MKERNSPKKFGQQEVNLKQLFQKVLENKWLYIFSIALCSVLAFLYIKFATPEYEVSTSILLDTSGSNRDLGKSDYVDGGVSLIEMEKNIYNEIGIIKSFSLMRQTVEDLDFDVSYFSKGLIKENENHGHFPFEVVLDRTKAQMYYVPFEVVVLSDEKYSLNVDASDFVVSNPTTKSSFEVLNDFTFKKEYSFGEKVENNYFTFTVKKPDYDVADATFKDKKLSFLIKNLDDVASGYQSSISVDNIDLQASIFNITTTGVLVSKEVEFLKKLTENYIKNQLYSRNSIANNKELFIRNQLLDVSDSLAKVEAELQFFKQNKRAINLGATATNALGQSSNLMVEKAKIEMNIRYFKSLISNVQNNRNSDDFTVPSSAALNDPLISANITELKSLYSLRSKKKFFVTENNQEMTILNNQINETIDVLLNNLRNAINSAQFSLSSITSQLSSFNGVINSLPERENQLLNIERKSTLYENLFNYLSQELAKTGIAGAENTSDTRVLDEARMVGGAPVFPNKKMILSLGFLLGLIIPTIKLALFTNNDSIEDISQITSNTDIPVIASIVKYDLSSKKHNSELSLWKIKESFRDLYANIELKKPEDDCCVIGMTSIMPNEGKTYCSINLGITLAEAGHRTLIIDGDLRNPSLVENGFNKINGKGLSNYLNGDIDSLDDIIYPHEKLNNLKFIPTVVISSNVHSLLTGDRMKALTEILKKDFDYIILDTPAAGVVSDFLLFTKYIDFNLFVMRRNISKIEFLNDFEKLNDLEEEKKSYIIYNDALEKTFKYGYGQKYGTNEETQLIDSSLEV